MAIRPTRQTGRNEPCPCNSGLKFKHCHGDEIKRAICNVLANDKMVELIHQEQIKQGIVEQKQS